ncbi:hypothetical protein HanRHA438_Chr02g0092971 [Helianthus annuus]|uniref:Uncharacterized protein n=1 Tax=Helianthus annuus TaxID=4232 RepID=A0A9K3JRT7_HELAN|nr:hypothetical protein HanXRQr2_Chr02g0081821 [Helianthus annuus]KAJ0941299.1 hypothetical protein HanRHA438_Chr02g0092971 [Helianthus annuus]
MNPDQQPSDGSISNDEPPSLTAVRPLEISQISGGIDDYADDDEVPLSTRDVRPLNTSQVSGIGGEYDASASAQPLSTGAVRPLENSQVSGAGDHYHYASSQPPSIGTVRPLDENLISDSNEVAAPAAAATVAPKFKLRSFHPNIFQRDNNEY